MARGDGTKCSKIRKGKVMSELQKLLKKLGLLLATSLLFAILWFVGLEMVYARVLVFSTNTVITMTGGDSEIKIEEMNGKHHFRVFKTIDGVRGSYVQQFGSLLIPVVMIFSWQLFTAFYLKRRRALSSSALNFGVYLAIQVIFMLLLTGFHTSSVAKFINILFLDSFYIVALAIIIIDNFRNPIFLSFLKPQGS